MITAILLAAGQSKRLINQNKLIKNYKRKPLINHVVQSIIKSKIFVCNFGAWVFICYVHNQIERFRYASLFKTAKNERNSRNDVRE